MSSSTTDKTEFPLCCGNPCSRCRKCCDWRYSGNIDGDFERSKRGESNDIFEYKRWYRNPNGPSVTCSYYYYDHFGPIGVEYGFDICRCA